ncbi:MAG: serine/threonine-protein phosphatase [Euzebyales bacterium]|nr:serine/threonine-protein phosphatase [Euzebyales bacterium]
MPGTPPAGFSATVGALAPGDHVLLAEAALELHTAGRGADQVTSLLERLVGRLGLGEGALYVPAVIAGGEMRIADPTELSVDVRDQSGTVLGVLRCRPRHEAAEPALRALAAHTGVALGGAGHLREVEHDVAGVRQVAERFQDSLLPELPTVEHTTLAVAYRAASREAKVGGDFYDVVPLPGGHVLIVVGDVVGKGIVAAVHTSIITQTLRALALQGLELDDLLARADIQVRWQREELIATLWCGLYEPETGELSFASLGHPPALLLRAGGDHLRLELHGLPLGLRDLLPEPPEVRTRRLEPRDLLVLYTDGVVEASRDYFAGQDALLAAVAARHDEPVGEILVAALEELLLDAGHTDDAVMLLLRRR